MQEDKPKASNSDPQISFSYRNCVSSQITFSRTVKRQEHWSEDARLEWYYRTFPRKHRTIGMMGHVPGGLCNTWKMAKNGTASSYQYSRVKSNLVRSTSLQGFKGPTDYDTHKQYNMRCLHKSSGETTSTLLSKIAEEL
ncbi:hypothetical protein GLOIN_2v1768423 [Rhizophagus irregularis DAOM 181602=DAOM 197198]|uniref:Uncharacterized protein n=1 Tax=Rhizophagus irregularis (strain DAOM 181602 / DAOM 197198 / MUCL 43194) TaxID=747089 RepID=A0A2P4QH73_RHIID|nr:hypothetical protein GLOIN_2v1768423 [Rhizophagus irregularis DAOM 181602=DAOM 197198]POG76956.1 hypothetical protein GLOIN_2v1768423 [Rhizophagus irregularis DAOM 181602=DAOM 197198]GBC22256.2 hypothetical protein GLOIN_2v1768423 [Rhizophagus irregularis DAOM 181602=DAOM 197198]|eukprot:XP_025183822.1 hypothetical protein GLOIN_2v1768423 [Rhizophagus irregularis DAOM 181602=DAOM 197198]